MVWSQHMNTDQEDLHLCSGLCVLCAAGLTGRETIWTPAGHYCLLCLFLLSCVCWRRWKKERKRISSAAGHKRLIFPRLPYRIVSSCYKLIKAIYYYPSSEWAFHFPQSLAVLHYQTVCTCSDSNSAGIQCRAKLQVSVSSMKQAANTLWVRCRLVALQSLPIPWEHIRPPVLSAPKYLLAPICRGLKKGTKGQAQNHAVRQQPNENTLIPDLVTALPCTHSSRDWALPGSTDESNHQILCYWTVQIKLPAKISPLWNTWLVKNKDLGDISAFWQSSLGLKHHDGFSFLYELNSSCLQWWGKDWSCWYTTSAHLPQTTHRD